MTGKALIIDMLTLQLQNGLITHEKISLLNSCFKVFEI